MKKLLCCIAEDLDKAESGNRAAAQRVRTCSIKFEKKAKAFRKESVQAEKSGEFKKVKSAAKKKAAAKPAKKKAVKKAAKPKKAAKKPKVKANPKARKRATAKLPKRAKRK